MTIRRCAHSVYVPSDVEGDESPYCSFCKSGQSMLKLRHHEEREADEKSVCCPICSSKDLQYVSEAKYNCPNCGHDQDGIL